MSYLQFHLVFTLPWALLLAGLGWRAARRGRPLHGSLDGTLDGSLGRGNRFAVIVLAVHALVALLYTTPWDNYLVYRQVWGYPEGAVLATLGYVPVEEYLFFLLQTLMTGLFLFWLGRTVPAGTVRPVARPYRVRVLGAVVLLVLAALGLLALGVERGTYLGLILVWAAPILALQWGVGGDLLVERARWLLPAVIVPTFYLWLADRFALAQGIWWISEELTSGVTLLGLPIEEAVFFLATNLLVVFGLLLVLHPESSARLRELRGAHRWWRGTLLLWGLCMVPTPLFPDAFAPLAYLSTTLLALGVLGYALERYQARAWLLFAVAFGFGLALEWVGSRTGIPFGRYHYTAPGPALLGVPLLVPLGWWAFTMIALAVAPRRGVRFLAPLALVAWDLGLDPLMVQRGFWRFDGGGAYQGVPLGNFLGWYLAGVVLVSILLWLEPRLAGDRPVELRVLFVVQAFLMTFGLAFFGLPQAALVTGVAMGGLGLAWFVPQARRQPSRSG